MKLIDVINNIDKSKQNESRVDTYDLGRELNVDIEWVNQDRLKSYWIGNWCCTDSYVGCRVYFLDDEPVAVSSQLGRKCDETFEWISKEAALKVREYLFSLIVEEEYEFIGPLCDLNEDVEEGYKIHYNSNIINKDMATLNGEDVFILERIKETPDYGIDRKLRLKLPSGNEKVVNILDLDFKYHLKKSR